MKKERSIEKRMERKVERYMAKGVKIFFMILFGIILFLLVIYILMQLWNWLMPDLFGLTTITYWQAVGIMVLAKIIFGFGGGEGGGRKKARSKHSIRSRGQCGPLKKDFEEWKLYDQFWKEEGEAVYKKYVEKVQDNEGGHDQTQTP